MNKLYLNYYEKETLTTNKHDENDDYSFSIYEKEFDPLNLYSYHPKFMNTEEIQTNLDIFKFNKVFIVIVRYTTGSTFGTTRGNWQIEGVSSTKEEAEKIKSVVLSNYKLKKTDSEFIYQNWQPWYDYFASIEEIEIHEMEIKHEDRKNKK